MILFLHISKSAGSTFVSLAHKNARPYRPSLNGLPVTGIRERDFIPYWNWPKKEHIGFLECTAYDFLALEVSPNGTDEMGRLTLMHENVDYVTILRDPLDVLISFHAMFDKYHPGTLPNLEDFLLDYRPDATNNIFTRALSGSTGNDLEKAKSNLKKFSAIIFLDNFSEDIMVMNRKFGWLDLDVERNRKGTTNNKTAIETLSSSLYDRLRELNSNDYELFEYARDLKRNGDY